MNRKILLFLAVILGVCNTLSAQTQFGTIRGKVVDETTRLPVDFAAVVVKLNGELRGSTLTDENGNFIFKTLQPGVYSLEVSNVGYGKAEITGIQVLADKEREITVGIKKGVDLKPVIVKDKPPIIDPDGSDRTSFTAENILKMPSRNPNQIATIAAGVTSNGTGGTPNFRGSRSDGTAYYIDGVRVTGSITLPTNALGDIQIISGGVPAQYGDFTGGAISLTTRAPSRIYTGTVEVISSSPFDKYHFNNLEAYLSGPILKKKGSQPGQERSLIGFSSSISVNYTQDNSPSSIGVWKTKSEKLSSLERTPLRLATGGTGFVPNAEFVTANDLERVDAKLNTPRYSINYSGSFVYQPSTNILITLGGQINYLNQRAYSFSSSLFNYKQNPELINQTYRGYLKFTQLFPNKQENKEKKPLITNAYYTVRLDYTLSTALQQDAEHKDRFFDYGYLGKFKTYSTPFYNTFNPGVNGSPKNFIDQNGDTVSLSFFQEMVAFSDTLYTFERAETNPIRANYTSNYYDLVAQLGGRVRNLNQVRQNLGLVNGDNPIPIYSQMWVNPGTALSGYAKSQAEQYTIFAMGEGTLNKNGREHALQFGMQHEQRISRSYSLAANGLWTLARQLMNQQFNAGLANKADENGYYRAELVYDANGVFQDTVRYKRAYNGADQSFFDKNVRGYLIGRGEKDVYGNPINEQSFIDINSYTPDDLKLTMFSADELLNNGNSQVNYSGYDAYGNKVKGKPSYDRFLNGERIVGAYQPVYQAVWAEDRFRFKELIMRIGVRVERFDNNMPVLKDPFSLYPIRTAGEVTALGATPISHPGNIGSNYAVYVDDIKNPTKILGYRNGIDWYSADGNRITDPTVLATETRNGSIVQPYLVDQTNQVLTSSGSFKDYEPQVNVLPRIWFSFPISGKAQFFANYDVLTQRPTEGTIGQIDDYFYLQNRAQGIIGNPALKPTRKTDYELGFRQAVGNDDNASLSIIASYSEMRNLLTQYRYNQAYPISYTTFGNLDFSTVKGFRIEYELRELGNISLRANYALQFADGTGSNSGSSAALLASGLPNLRTLFPLDFDIRHVINGLIDYHYRSGKEYNGPVIGNTKIFENTGVAFVFNLQSGRPYTVDANPTASAQPGTAGRSPIKGNPNGSRLPWQYFTDVTVDRTIATKLGKYKNGQDRNGSLVIFLQITNLFNTKNIVGVYRYSGSPDTDGYLTSPTGQQALTQATNAQSFIDLYNIRVANPGNYALPRWTKLGVRFTF